MVKRTSRRTFLPGLLALAVALSVGVWVYVTPRQEAPAPAVEPVKPLEFPAHVPTPLIVAALPAPTPTPVEPPALLQVRVVLATGTGEVRPTRLVWDKAAGLDIPAGGVLDATLPSDLYRFRIQSDDGLCLEEKNLLLESGEVRPVTFTLQPAASLSVHILANVRKGTPEGARVLREAIKNELNEKLLRFQPADTFYADASGSLRLSALLPGARYTIVASATGFLEQSQEFTAGEIDAATFYLNPGGVIAGRVVDSRLGAGAMGVGLYLWGHSTKPMITTSTTDGAFSFKGVWPGRYSIEAAKDAGVITSQGTPQPIELALAERKEDVLLVLGTGGTILARINPFVLPPEWFKSRRVPLDEVDRVEVAGPQLSRRADLDFHGQAVITGLPDGGYEVRLRGMIWPQLSRYVTIEDGTTVEVIFNVSAGDFIAGTVEDWHGNPVAGAEVSRMAQNPEAVGQWIDSFTALGGSKDAVTSATGYFYLKGLRPAVYNLVARATEAAPGAVMNVSTGRTDVVIRLAEGGRIEGRVYDAEGSPRAGARVVLTHAPVLNAAGMYRGTVVADDAGRFSAAHLPAGGYVAELRATDRGRQRPDSLRLVDVRDGETTTVNFGGGVTLMGRVEIDGKSPIRREDRPRGGTLVGRAPFWLPVKEALPELLDPRARTDAEGRYTLRGLPGGERAWIALSAPDLGMAHLVEVKLPKDGTATKDFILKTGSIKGRVVDARGAPVANRTVGAVLLKPGQRARDVSDWSLDKVAGIVLELMDPRARTDRDGTFTLAGLLPGDYRIMAGEMERLDASALAKVQPDGRGQEVEIVIEERGTLVGRVLGPPVAHESRDYALLLQNEEGVVYPYPQLRVDPRRGTFQLAEVPPGTYEAMVVAGLSGTISLPARAKHIVIRSGAESYAEFRLQAGYPVQLTAYDARTGQPVVGVEVEVRGGGGGRVQGIGSLSGLYNGWMGVLAEGTYTLRVSHPDYQRFDLPVEVGPEGGSRFLSARLQPKS